MGKYPDVIEATHMVLHLMKAGMAIYGYPAVAITSEFLRTLGFRPDVKGMAPRPVHDFFIRQNEKPRLETRRRNHAREHHTDRPAHARGQA